MRGKEYTIVQFAEELELDVSTVREYSVQLESFNYEFDRDEFDEMIYRRMDGVAFLRMHTLCVRADFTIQDAAAYVSYSLGLTELSKRRNLTHYQAFRAVVNQRSLEELEGVMVGTIESFNNQLHKRIELSEAKVTQPIGLLEYQINIMHNRFNDLEKK